jgi:hypothetical protein
MYFDPMNSNALYGNVVTTIQNPTLALLELAGMSSERNELLFVVGDKKTPIDFSLPSATYISVEDQNKLTFNITESLSWNSYTRKMLGYLKAAKAGCKFIRETDDDNFPLTGYFNDFPDELVVRDPNISGDWINPYIYFSDEYLWPRGYPIELIQSDRKNSIFASKNYSESKVTNIGVIQGLANGAPDVDALFRLVFDNSDEFKFKDQLPLLIPKGTFAPFNSQVTIWRIELLPLMYLPKTCTFRMTDIWRSFIAAHLMHLNGYELIFTSASAFQDRNTHNLLRDFSEEVPGYLGNTQLITEIRKVKVSGGVDNLAKDLKSVYLHLVAKEFFTKDELTTLEMWLKDCEDV